MKTWGPVKLETVQKSIIDEADYNIKTLMYKTNVHIRLDIRTLYPFF